MATKFRQFFYAITLSLLSTSAMATENGGVGLYPDGLDNYLSGALPPPGFHTAFYAGNIHYTELRGNHGALLPVPGFKANVNFLAPRALWVTEKQILGGQLAFHMVMPLLDVTLKGNGQSSNNKGIGDVTVGSVLGYHPQPDLDYVIGLDTYAPTGRYNRQDPASVGKNHWGLQPAMAVSYSPAYGINADLKVMYDINFKNKATNTTSGQAIHADYALGWGVGNGLVLGVGGYVFQQITNDHGPNSAQGKESGFGLGPSVRYANNKGWLLTLKWQKDIVANNRPAGSQVFLKAVVPF
ncbi:hypothetical protein FE392_06240 [Xenorhabdus sp. 12]|uniref:Phenol degradation protein meta n=1 Tax=Xenorhabdus santafensis TaxID=2582833 RepID=A0ABU4S820_9GAMM|nr:transporter [Xenorhabdus sp. 12]MDX7986930.1 hypothetical protein [Xenorhabdus sp. 12]